MRRPHLITIVALLATATAYIPHEKEHFLTDALLREMVDRMGKDLVDAADAYVDFPVTNRLGLVPGRTIKDLEAEERQQQFPLDYDHILDVGNPSPSIRDQEYLQHSSLWGHQYMTGGAGEGNQRLKPDGTVKNQNEVKTDAALPAYCNPPNPCPIGHTADDGCLEDFENTAAYREYQAEQDCMCDSEHMFDCPMTSSRDMQSSAPGSNELTESDIDRIMEQFQVEDQHKSLVAKKYHVKKDGNPFLRGERLPVAAKKGINVNY